MPHINIACWPLKSDEVAQKLLEGITRVVNETVGCPLDKISVSIQEIDPSRWSDAGIVGNSPEFVLKSRRKQYETIEEAYSEK